MSNCGNFPPDRPNIGFDFLFAFALGSVGGIVTLSLLLENPFVFWMKQKLTGNYVGSGESSTSSRRSTLPETLQFTPQVHGSLTMAVDSLKFGTADADVQGTSHESDAPLRMRMGSEPMEVEMATLQHGLARKLSQHFEQEKKQTTNGQRVDVQRAKLGEKRDVNEQVTEQQQELNGERREKLQQEDGET
jgi:hypothetical protein